MLSHDGHLKSYLKMVIFYTFFASVANVHAHIQAAVRHVYSFMLHVLHVCEYVTRSEKRWYLSQKCKILFYIWLESTHRKI